MSKKHHLKMATHPGRGALVLRGAPRHWDRPSSFNATRTSKSFLNKKYAFSIDRKTVEVSLFYMSW